MKSVTDECVNDPLCLARKGKGEKASVTECITYGESFNSILIGE